MPAPENTIKQSYTGGPALVHKAQEAPGTCAVTSDFEGPFIDTGTELEAFWGRLFLHAPLIEEYATQLLGMISAKEADALKDRIAELEDEANATSMALDALQKVPA